MQQTSLNKPSSRLAFCVVAWLGILSVALILRLGCASGELWLDEVWSLNHIFESHNLREVLFRAHDNNHPLNSLYLYWVGVSSSSAVCRGFSLFTGTLSIPLLFFWMRSLVSRVEDGESARIERASWIAAGLAALSFMWINYSSEARGYAPALFFCLLSHLFHNRYLMRSRWWMGAACVLTAALAVLSHLTAVFFLLAAFIDDGRHWLKCQRGKGGRSNLVGLAPSALFVILFGLYYVLCFRGVVIGGGQEANLADALAQGMSYTLGAPLGPDECFRLLSIGVSALALLYAVIFGPARPLGLFFVLGFALAILAVVFGPSDQIYPRYFFVLTPCLLAAAGLLLERGLSHTRIWGKGVSVAVLAVVAATQGFRIYELDTNGRGNYIPLISYIKTHTSESPCTISSDGDFRNQTMLTYYRNYFGDMPVDYRPTRAANALRSEWLIIHRFHGQPPTGDVHPGSRAHTLVLTLPGGRLSGWDLLLYQRGH